MAASPRARKSSLLNSTQLKVSVDQHSISFSNCPLPALRFKADFQQLPVHCLHVLPSQGFLPYFGLLFALWVFLDAVLSNRSGDLKLSRKAAGDARESFGEFQYW